MMKTKKLIQERCLFLLAKGILVEDTCTIGPTKKAGP